TDVEFGGSLAVDRANMSATFDYGMRCATRGLVWLTEEQAAARSKDEADLKPFATADCPLIPRRPS
ncbi:MAG: hypothetical protein RIR33_1569, partial [Pseudomonadota bacterium]